MTLKGMAPFMIANALAASLAAFVHGVSLDQIRAALSTFEASSSQTPGRMNLFEIGDYSALIDYAHNAHSYKALGEFVKNWPGERIGVVGGPGDRRDEDFMLLGELSAEIFDRVIVKEDDDTRGRPRGDAADWIAKGIEKSDRPCKYEIILNETDAVNTALDSAPKESLVVILPETVSRALRLIESRLPSKN
jgi:cyanophycin synthetase